MDEEVDEDPSDMIENINDMLTECRVILDTDVDGPAKQNQQTDRVVMDMDCTEIDIIESWFGFLDPLLCY